MDKSEEPSECSKSQNSDKGGENLIIRATSAEEIQLVPVLEKESDDGTPRRGMKHLKSVKEINSNHLINQIGVKNFPKLMSGTLAPLHEQDSMLGLNFHPRTTKSNFAKAQDLNSKNRESLENFRCSSTKRPINLNSQ